MAWSRRAINALGDVAAEDEQRRSDHRTPDAPGATEDHRGVRMNVIRGE